MTHPELCEQHRQCEVRKGLLYHLKRGRGDDEVMAQIMIPQSHHQDLLCLAHASPLGGHLGKEKTIAQVLCWVFLVGVLPRHRAVLY